MPEWLKQVKVADFTLYLYMSSLLCDISSYRVML